ncbi:MAG: T9SS C-terminal target domain-containing protein, partial [Flavobacteriales bacterium]|nr:T9SS C-terminal target domain-containing protein [Flavobacteriales bacterium]
SATNKYDTTFNFEGYQIYQVKNATVTAADIFNPDLARLAFQCDVKNGVKQLVNYEFDQAIGGNVPTEMVNGSDEGIVHSFVVTKDLFASGDDRLVNHKPYYFLAISYGYNMFKKYDQQDPYQLDGQKKPYKAGRRNIRTYTGIPHIASPEAGGTSNPADYGDGVQITRMIGQGNGGRVLAISQETEDSIFASPKSRAYRVKYQNGAGPVDIKIIDPLNVPAGDFTMYFTGGSNSVTGIMDKTTKWYIINDASPSDTVWSDKNISIANEQILSGKFGKNKDGGSYNWGMSVSLKQVEDPGKNKDAGLLESSILTSGESWLRFVADADGGSIYNWIRSGTINNSDTLTDDFLGVDDGEDFETVLEGTWAPYRLASHLWEYGPAWKNFHAQVKMSQLASVDVVFTSDKSKWTRCPVIELGPNSSLNEGGTSKFSLRSGASVDKNGNPDGTGTGMGWFPGYAINIETGERLNVMFGENSWLSGHNGRDMIFNPTSIASVPPLQTPVLGGMHYLYIFGHNGNTATDMPAYDNGAFAYNKLSTNNSIDRRNVFKDCMWTAIPMMAPGSAWLNGDIRIQLRIRKPYVRDFAIVGETTDTLYNTMSPQAPVYKFSTYDVQTVTGDLETAKDAMELVNVVPNPYYAYSAYEANQIDTRIKITNLPEKCTVSIYTISGTMIRKFKKDEPATSLEWDLKNSAGIPVASGIYLIHVDAGDAGEKVLKWFGVMRPIDLDTF